MAYPTPLTHKTRACVTQGRHPANQALDIQIQPRDAPDNDLCSLIAGVVVHAGGGEDPSYGITVTVEGSGLYSGYFTRYAHMSSVLVAAGDSVNRGTPLGFEGRTGTVTGPHVHLEILGDSGAPVSDETFAELLGFPIAVACYDIEYNGDDPDPPDPTKSKRRRGKPWLYKRLFT